MNKRLVVVSVAVFLLAMGVLFAIEPTTRGVPVSVGPLMVAVLGLGPAAFLLAGLACWPAVGRGIGRVLIAVIAYVVGILVFLIVAVNTGRIQP